MSDAKQFYKTYQADDNLSPLSDRLFQLINAENPAHVFEFGCGTGKNLKALPEYVVKCGLDISLTNIIHANVRNDQEFLIKGNEHHLGHLQYFDVVFTCSVLDHIALINKIIHDFKRMARKAVILAETNDEVAQFYYKHNYESMGFVKDGFEWVGNDGATYHIWIWRKGYDNQMTTKDDMA